jgi:iron-sulfur cluster repair protein YtfE (RIC family)
MASKMADPVRELEHTHGHLNELALDVEKLLGEAQAQPEARAELIAALELLRDELLTHFANEEEGLFPFIRAGLPAKAGTVDRLEGAHDAICGAVTRLVYLAGHEGDASALGAVHRRFVSTYAEHSQMEAALFEELGRTLTPVQRGELALLLRGVVGGHSA